jgi:transcriptional regulator with XRE-family HTH domain
MQTFGKIISTARKKLGLSQKELASRIKKEDGTPISAQYLNDIEHDRRNPPSESMIVQLAKELKLDKDFLCIAAGTIPRDIQQGLINAGQQRAVEVVKAFRRNVKK